MKQFNKLYFNGCSHTAGGGLEVFPPECEQMGVYPIKGYRELGLDVNWKHCKEVAYPQRVSENLNINVVNEAKQGGSFSRMVRMFWEYISNHGDKDTLFFLEYPNGLRHEFWSTDLDDYVVVNTAQTTEYLLDLDTPSFTGGQRSYDSPKFLDDRDTVNPHLETYFKHLFNPDCKTHFNQELVLLYGMMLHCEQNKIPLIITDLTKMYDNVNDKPFLKMMRKLLESRGWKYVKIIEHIQEWCKWKSLLIEDDLKGLKAHRNPDGTYKEYVDGHPGYYGHIEYGKFLTEKIEEWYK